MADVPDPPPNDPLETMRLQRTGDLPAADRALGEALEIVNSGPADNVSVVIEHEVPEEDPEPVEFRLAVERRESAGADAPSQVESSARARTESVKLIYGEAVRMRELQEKQVDDTRSRSAFVFVAVSSALAIATGLAEVATVPLAAYAVAAFFIAAMASAAFMVHRPVTWLSGPNVDQLNERQYKSADAAHQVQRDLAHYHYQHFRTNAASVKQMQRWFTLELLFAAASVAAVLIGAVV